MADYYLHKTAAHIDELLEKVEGLNNYDDTEVRGLINNKVDKVTGKGLSTNDFTNAYKTELDGLDTALDAKVDKETGKGLSTNDYTTSEKTKLNGIEAGANVNVQSDWDQTDTTADDYIKNKPTIPDAQIQSDWNQTNTESKDFIKNKPTIPAAQIPSDWNAVSGVAQILNKPALGTAATKDYTTAVSGLSDDLITSSAVNTVLSNKADLLDGKVPASQLPSYVDDVVEYASTSAFPETGESGKIYISTDTNKTYRWGGSAYVEISESLALGETASTAYAGNKGKANADAIAAIKDGTNIDSFADVETALAAKLNTADVDDALSSTSTNPVQNKAVQAPLATLIDNGAKNLLHIDNVHAFSAAGVTFTVNSDGTINASGTATGDAHCSLTLGGTFDSDQVYIDRFCDGKHMLAGCPSGGNYSSGYSMYAASGTYNVIDEGNGVLLTPSAITNIRIIIMIRQGTNADGLVFKPMICTAEDWAVSHKIVSYVPSNLELYEISPRKKSIRHNFTTSDYEEIPECSVTVPPNKMALIVASLKWNNSYPRGIKMSIGSISKPDRIFGIAESEENYSGITAHGLITNTTTNNATVQIYAKSGSATGNDVNIVYWIL